MGFSFVSWIVMMSIFVLSVRFFSSCIFVVSPLMFICIIVMVFLEFICCFSFASSSVWNSIPNGVRCAPSLSSSKSRLKTFLLCSVYKD